jgi:hypothetical protein
MVNQRGQTISEYTVVLGLLTVFGAYLFLHWISPSPKSGVAASAAKNASDKIASDPS